MSITPRPHIPTLLLELVKERRWPATGADFRAQDAEPRVALERIQVVAPDEQALRLDPPPFVPLADEIRRAQDFWLEQGALAEVDADLTLVIGDFGAGSDAPIVLDYRGDRENPKVLRLQWTTGGNHWIEIAQDFRTLVDLLGL